MSPEALMTVLDALILTKERLDEAHNEVNDAIDILVAEMKAAGILHKPQTP